ncbi:hypothetical protein BDZ89DRAFT_1033421 [Hymenopellis radicata]|nr:hypothetical protein BDZ89DRAFT_1033421 [Hymenopellis radicata]
MPPKRPGSPKSKNGAKKNKPGGQAVSQAPAAVQPPNNLSDDAHNIDVEDTTTVIDSSSTVFTDRSADTHHSPTGSTSENGDDEINRDLESSRPGEPHIHAASSVRTTSPTSPQRPPNNSQPTNAPNTCIPIVDLTRIPVDVPSRQLMPSTTDRPHIPPIEDTQLLIDKPTDALHPHPPPAVQMGDNTIGRDLETCQPGEIHIHTPICATSKSTASPIRTRLPIDIRQPQNALNAGSPIRHSMPVVADPVSQRQLINSTTNTPHILSVDDTHPNTSAQLLPSPIHGTEPGSPPQHTNVTPADPSVQAMNTTAEVEVKPLFEPPALRTLPRFSEIGEEFNVGCRSMPYCELYQSFQNNTDKLRRILNLTIEASGCDLHSWFTIDPKDFTRVSTFAGSKSFRVVAKTPGAPVTFNDVNVTFFVIGRCSHSSLFDDGTDTQMRRSISIQLIHRFTPRMVSSTASILDYRNPIFTISHGSLAIQTALKIIQGKFSPKTIEAKMDGTTHGDYSSQNHSGKVPSQDNRSKDGRHYSWRLYVQPSLSSTRSLTQSGPRKFEHDVPCFEGANGFDLNCYHELPPRAFEYDDKDIVLVAFSLTGYREQPATPSQAGAQKIGMSIRFTIHVARVEDGDDDPTDTPVEASLRDETPLSVSETAGITQKNELAPVKKEIKRGRIM